MTTRHSYAEQLEKLKNNMLKMAGLAEEAIAKAIQALSSRNGVLAGKIIEEDAQINDYEEMIEELCVLLIATEQPVATDLRFIVSCLNTIRDLERVGDYAAHTAKTVLTLEAEENGIHIPEDIIRMTEVAGEMLRGAMDAFAAKNAESAENIIRKDEIVDSLYLKVFRELIKTMEKDPGHVRQENALIFLAKFVERMADHTVNICEEIIYFVTGEKTDTK